MDNLHPIMAQALAPFIRSLSTARTSSMTHAKISFEVELGFSGQYHPAIPERGPTYDCGGEPAEPASVEDVTLESFGGLRLNPTPTPGGRYQLKWTTTDFLAGVDTKNPEVLKLLQNICDFCAEDTERALIDEAQS